MNNIQKMIDMSDTEKRTKKESFEGQSYIEGLRNEIRTIRSRARRKRVRGEEPTACWVEEEVLRGEETKALVIIFSTVGCYFAETSGCSMCGYTNESITAKPKIEEINRQFDYAMKKYSPQTKVLKIFTSGSFFDKREIPEEAQYEILGRAKEKFSKIIVETRSEFVNENMLLKAKDKGGNVEIAIGLESSNDNVLRYSVNKGSSFMQFKNACMVANKVGVSVKAYVIVKPPFLTEREGYYDAYCTVKDVCEIENISTISFNPVNVQSYTLVERMYSRGEYRPPWLWTVAKVLLDSKKVVGERIRLISSPTAGGTSRGAYNCDKCNSKVLESIRRFSLKQDMEILEKVFEEGCECLESWKDILDLEGFMQSCVPMST